MQRRDFIKLSMAAGTAVLLPDFSGAKELDISQIMFSSGINSTNNAQTIIIFMYGGASQLGGNLSNIEEIKTASQSNYDNYFRGLTPTVNKCWQEAGGSHMESLIANGDMTLFRCCYSKVREENDNKSHDSCIVQNQKGSFDDNSAGILANLAQILEANGVVNENTLMPFITLEGESKFYIEGKTPLNGYLKPVGLSEDLENPYSRYERDWRYYTPAESDIPNYDDDVRGFNAPLYAKIDQLAQRNNVSGKIKDAFARRASLSTFIDNIVNATTPDLGLDAYPTNNRFSKKLETAVKLLSNNPDTKVVTIGTGA